MGLSGRCAGDRSKDVPQVRREAFLPAPPRDMWVSMFALLDHAEPEYYFRFLSIHPKHSTFKSLFTELTSNNVSMTKGSQSNPHSFKFSFFSGISRNIYFYNKYSFEFIYLLLCILSFTTPQGLFGLRSPTEFWLYYLTVNWSYFTPLWR